MLEPGPPECIEAKRYIKLGYMIIIKSGEGNSYTIQATNINQNTLAV